MTQVDLARRLCAAYVAFRMGTRRIDATLPYVPKKIGIFWIEMARLVTLKSRRSAPSTCKKTLR